MPFLRSVGKMEDPLKDFYLNRVKSVQDISSDYEFQKLSSMWIEKAIQLSYPYNFDWFGRPVIQFPQDLIALQEVIFSVKPDLIIETGVAHGGSVVFSASMLALLDLMESHNKGESLHPNQPERFVVGIDIDIRQHNRDLIECHPLANRIKLYEGSSISAQVKDFIYHFSSSYSKTLVILDSHHTHEHVLEELRIYSPLVSVGSYIVVLDTFVENLTLDLYPDRPWGKGNNPMTAVRDFLMENKGFKIDDKVQKKLALTLAPNGFLKRTEEPRI